MHLTAYWPQLKSILSGTPSSEPLWEAEYHILTRPRQAQLPRNVSLTPCLQQIRFEGPTPSLRPKRGRVDAQQVRRLRKITPETAALFERLWGESPAASLRRAVVKPSVAVDLGVEGGRKWRKHLALERDRRVIEAKKRAVLADTGRLACEVCRFDFAATYGNDLDGFAEVHHLAPLSLETRRVKTRLEDLAILCANCHRAIHRIGPEMLGIEDMRRKYRGRRRG